METMSIQRKIKKLRTRHGYTQKVLADMAGISDFSISKIESGDRSAKISTLLAILDVLGAHINLPENVSLDIGQRRYAANMTQSELARLAGVGTDTVYRVEAGQGDHRLYVLEKIYSVFNVRLEINENTKNI